MPPKTGATRLRYRKFEYNHDFTIEIVVVTVTTDVGDTKKLGDCFDGRASFIGIFEELEW